MPAINVWPSGFARATSAAAIVPAAPALFSTTTGCPSSTVNRAPSLRAIKSVEAPGANGTSNRIGRSGYLS